MAEKFDLGRIVLIHGAAHGAWCWEEIVPLLRARGFEVTAPDLPGLGADTTPAKDVTMENYIQRIVEAVGDSGPPVLLVGHSMAGLPISGAAERMPSRISKLIYLSAVLPQDGEKLTDFTEVKEGESSAAHAVIDSAEEGAHEFDPAMAVDTFYSLCTPEQAGRAITRLKPQPDAPLVEPVHMTEAGWGRVSKTYIICTEDRAHPVSRQHWYCDRMPDVKRVLLKADHSPFYSNPIGLAQLICAEASCQREAP